MDAPVGPSGLVGGDEELDLAGLGDVAGHQPDDVGSGSVDAIEVDRPRAGCGPPGRGGRHLGRSQHPRLGQVGGVGEARRLPHDHADTHATVTTGGELLDPAVVEQRRGGTSVLGEHLREIGTAGQAGREDSLDDCFFEHGCHFRFSMVPPTMGAGHQ